MAESIVIDGQDGEQKHVFRSRELKQRFGESGCCFRRLEFPMQVLNALRCSVLIRRSSGAGDDVSLQSRHRGFNSVPDYYIIS